MKNTQSNNPELSVSDYMRQGLPLPKGTSVVTAWFKNELTGLLEVREIPLKQ